MVVERIIRSFKFSNFRRKGCFFFDSFNKSFGADFIVFIWVMVYFFISYCG